MREQIKINTELNLIEISKLNDQIRGMGHTAIGKIIGMGKTSQF